MHTVRALNLLVEWEAKGRLVYTTGDLSRLFREPRSGSRLTGTLTRLVKEGILSRPTRGIYVFRLARSLDTSILACIALAARRGCTSIESFETAAARWGLIDQTYPQALTVATTGRSATFDTEWGHITLIHTQATAQQLIDSSIEMPDSPMRLASRELCLHNLKRSGRAPHLVIEYTGSAQ